MMFCDRNHCTGCGCCAESCPTHCITMVPDQLGFLFPEVNKSQCIDCHLCEKNCPALNPVPLQAVQKVYAAWAKDDNIRTSSSSGGIFSVFAESVLARGGAINGVAFDTDLNLKHEMAYHRGESQRFRGSKYVQSGTNGIYQKIKAELVQKKEILFTGVPCQVAGLKKYLGKDYKNLICCDIICHGAPSPWYLRHYLKSTCPIPSQEMASIQFRDLTGWGNCRLNVYTPSGKTWHAEKEKNDYITAFLANTISNQSCYRCHYACPQRVGDITIGDFWGIGAWKKFRHNTQKGCSVVMLNTAKGMAFFESIKDQLFVEERNLREACRENPQLRHPAPKPIIRDQLSPENYFLFRQETKKLSRRINILQSVCALPIRILRKIVRNIIS